MIWVLLQSESPWQRNDAIAFFSYLCVPLYQEFFEEIVLVCLFVFSFYRKCTL